MWYTLQTSQQSANVKKHTLPTFITHFICTNTLTDGENNHTPTHSNSYYVTPWHIRASHEYTSTTGPVHGHHIAILDQGFSRSHSICRVFPNNQSTFMAHTNFLKRDFMGILYLWLHYLECILLCMDIVGDKCARHCCRGRIYAPNTTEM